MLTLDNPRAVEHLLWRRGLPIAFVAVGIALSLQLIYIKGYDWNPAALIGMPAYVADGAGYVPADIPRFRESGHDGGYIYLIARQPFRVDIKNAAFHVERWLYPLTAWALAFGHEKWLPYSLPLVNLLATGLIAFFCGAALHLRCLNPWWALLCALGPGAAMSLRFNLVDQYVLAWICGAFLCFDRRKPIATTIFLALSVLSRPTAVGAVAAASVAAWVQHRSPREVGLYVLAVIPYFAWRAWLAATLDYPLNLFTGDSTFFSIPFLGLLFGLAPLLRDVGAIRAFLSLATVGFYFFIVLIVLWRAWTRRELSYGVFMTAGYGVAAMSLSPANWASVPMQIARFTPVFPFLIYMYAADQHWYARLLMAGIVAMALFGGLWMVVAPVMR